MNKELAFLATAIAAIIPASSAFAQDFDGPYVGVQAGYESTEAANPTTDLGVLSYDDSQGSFTGGIYAGYDKQIAPRFVLGVEAGMDMSSDDALDGRIGAISASIDPDWSLALTARAGYLVDAKSLLYVRGGYENARVETTMLGSSGEQLSENENRSGWTLGGGVERQLLQNISARLEYRYSDLSDGDDTWDRHRILAGVSYRF